MNENQPPIASDLITIPDSPIPAPQVSVGYQQPTISSAIPAGSQERLGGHRTSGTTTGRAAKWTSWMDAALVRQVLATDPINCGRGRTVGKWAQVSTIPGGLQPQPILRSPESCRQRVKKLVEIYKKNELQSLQKSGTNEEFGEFEQNMVELTSRWDQSSIYPATRKLAQEKAAQLERDGRRVREDSISPVPPRKKSKNEEARKVDGLLEDFMAGMRQDQAELEELQVKQDQKHEDLMWGILGLTDEIREQSKRRSHDAFLEREARKEELALILESLRKDGEI
ncbi:hypothetical protein HOY82DRAFT_600890 [Tuber indicum]|nr:hypothetical protein HOY82DRAFT_600890 [Tuber indicum]